ncbi:MAG: hypothetical protein MUO85_06475 [candidate division Zixibacteria bacterium]|nr:hypothetical protein [candidate division Zixibacteria bacterium]
MKMKVTKAFKVIITACLVITFTLSLAACNACKSEVVVEEQQIEEKGEVTIPSETKEETKETPSIVEETPEKIEWEGITFSPIEGLRFENGPFYFLDGNPYGGEVGERAGVAVFVEVNGKKTLFFGFRPNVVEFWYKKIMEEEKKIVYAFPIDLEQAKGIKIDEVELEYTKRDDDLKSGAFWLDSEYYPHWIEGSFWDNNIYLEVSNVPLGTKIYSPVSTSDYLIWDNLHSEYNLTFRDIIPEAYKGSLLFKNERVDFATLGIDAIGINPLPPGTEKKHCRE